MKHSFVPLLFTGLLIIFISCRASKKINEGLIIGKWSQEKVISIQPTGGTENYQAQLDSLHVPYEISSIKDQGYNKVVIVSGRTEKDGQVSEKGENASELRSFFPDIKNTIEFKADKSVTVTSRNTTMQGTWSMNGKGNKITLTIQNAASPFVLSLLKIDAASLEIVDHFPASDLQIRYKK